MGAEEPPKPEEGERSPRQPRNGVESTDQRYLLPVDDDDRYALALQLEELRKILEDEVEEKRLAAERRQIEVEKEKVPAKSPEIEKSGYVEDLADEVEKEKVPAKSPEIERSGYVEDLADEVEKEKLPAKSPEIEKREYVEDLADKVVKEKLPAKSPEIEKSGYVEDLADEVEKEKLPAKSPEIEKSGYVEDLVEEESGYGADDSISDSENYLALLGIFHRVLSRLYPYGPFGLLVPVTQILLHWAKDFESELLVSDDIKCLKEFLLELETKLLPLKGKWVPQHPYYVCVCSRDDEELLKHLNHSDAMKIIHLSYPGNCEKRVIQQNIAVILEAIGIPTLSKVVNRVAVYSCTIDCSSKASLVSRALNKAQVYLYKSKFEAKKYILQRLSHLEIFEVEKLAYRFAVRELEVFSKRQFECGCLRQGNNLYITLDSDSREISLELAQELVNGNPNRMANLFDLYITMEELNGQTEPMVSDGSSFHESAGTSQIANEKTGIRNDPSLPGNSHHRSTNCIVEIFNNRDQNTDPYGQHEEALVYSKLNVGSCKQNSANTGRHDEATKIGREGERRAFKHLKKIYGAGNVEWKNAEKESKLPFDFIIWEDECQEVIKCYVEVKATKYARKNCFTISQAEFECAYKHGEKYVIMHICLANGKKTYFKNPVEQLRQDNLRCSHMDILMPG